MRDRLNKFLENVDRHLFPEREAAERLLRFSNAWDHFSQVHHRITRYIPLEMQEEGVFSTLFPYSAVEVRFLEKLRSDMNITDDEYGTLLWLRWVIANWFDPLGKDQRIEVARMSWGQFIKWVNRSCEKQGLPPYTVGGIDDIRLKPHMRAVAAAMWRRISK